MKLAGKNNTTELRAFLRKWNEESNKLIREMNSRRNFEKQAERDAQYRVNLDRNGVDTRKL